WRRACWRWRSASPKSGGCSSSGGDSWVPGRRTSSLHLLWSRSRQVLLKKISRVVVLSRRGRTSDVNASPTLSRRASSSTRHVSDLVLGLCASLLPEGTTPTSHANWRLRSLGTKPSHGWLAATFYPCPAGTAPGTPETVFALKRSLEAWTGPTHLTGG